MNKYVDSIRILTLNDIEVIGVDSSPPDHNHEIVELHQQESPHAVLIRHEQNLGLAGTRITPIRPNLAIGVSENHLE